MCWELSCFGSLSHSMEIKQPPFVPACKSSDAQARPGLKQGVIYNMFIVIWMIFLKSFLIICKVWIQPSPSKILLSPIMSI